MGDVVEEAYEYGYWIELLVEAVKTDPQPAVSLLAESKETQAIAISSNDRAKRDSGFEE